MSELAAVGWILLPTLFALFLYFVAVLCVWPYARPRVPFFLLLFLVFFPPLFPGLLAYLLFLWCVFAPVVEPPAPTVIFVERGQVRGHASARLPARGNRV
jgi:hypothetical protein